MPNRYTSGFISFIQKAEINGDDSPCSPLFYKDNRTNEAQAGILVTRDNFFFLVSLSPHFHCLSGAALFSGSTKTLMFSNEFKHNGSFEA